MYLCPFNPLDYNGKENYDYHPNNFSEAFSIIHDRQYTNLGASGVKGAVAQTNTWTADIQLSISNVLSVPFNLNPVDQARSIVTAAVFGFIGECKARIQVVKSVYNKLSGELIIYNEKNR